jgi:chemotaxis protein MotB
MLSKDDMSKLKEELQKTVRKMENFEKLKNQIEMTVTAEGLRIELLETEKGTFFPSGASEPAQQGREILEALAKQLSELPNKISIEGHTDSKPFAASGTYTNWELSADRANAARRMVQSAGVRADQVTQVRGYADQHLRNPKEPEDPVNRRISFIVNYTVKSNPDENDPPAPSSQAPASKPTGPEGAKAAR